MFSQSTINTFFSETKPSYREEGVYLVMGITGSGQSTFVNYMAGVDMVNLPNGSRQVADDQKEICKTGYSAGSITSFPQIVKMLDRDIQLMDCPGFDITTLSEDTIDPEIPVIALQHAIFNAKSIKGIAVIIPDNDLSYKSHRYLIQLLENTIKNFYDKKDSVIFFVNNFGHENLTHDRILETLKKRAEKSGDKRFYELIKNNPEKLQLFNPTDPSMRDGFFAQLKMLKPIAQSDIHLSNYEKSSKSFYKKIQALTDSQYDLRECKQQLMEEKHSATSIDDIKNIDEMLAIVEKYIVDYRLLLQLKLYAQAIALNGSFANNYQKIIKNYNASGPHITDSDEEHGEAWERRMERLVKELRETVNKLVAEIKALEKTENENNVEEQKASASPR